LTRAAAKRRSSRCVARSHSFLLDNGTVYECDLSRSGGSLARLVWDSKYGQTCSQMSQPIICGSTIYTLLSELDKDWIDLAGKLHPPQSSVTIGANPILLEGH
jgi:hypothetical protein